MGALVPKLALDRIVRARKRRKAAEDEWRAAIVSAVNNGQSLRTVAAAAGVSHVRVLQIVRDH